MTAQTPYMSLPKLRESMTNAELSQKKEEVIEQLLPLIKAELVKREVAGRRKRVFTWALVGLSCVSVLLWGLWSIA